MPFGSRIDCSHCPAFIALLRRGHAPWLVVYDLIKLAGKNLAWLQNVVGKRDILNVIL